MVKKFLYTLINTVSLLIIVAAVAVLVLVLFTPSGQAPQVLGYTMLRVTTGSMEPTYAIDTLIVVKKEAPSAIQEGDIISFYSSDPALDGAVNTTPCDCGRGAAGRQLPVPDEGRRQQCGGCIRGALELSARQGSRVPRFCSASSPGWPRIL